MSRMPGDAGTRLRLEPSGNSRIRPLRFRRTDRVRALSLRHETARSGSDTVRLMVRATKEAFRACMRSPTSFGSLSSVPASERLTSIPSLEFSSEYPSAGAHDETVSDRLAALVT